MKPVHIPHPIVMFCLILLTAAFLTGTTLAFNSVRAAPDGALITTVTATPVASLSTTPEPVESLVSSDTTGLLVLGILLVAIILIGLLWGGRMGRR